MKTIPHHIAIIMDGNRRWAKAKGLPKIMGHKKGYGKIKEVAQWAFDSGVSVLTLFAFSTENWKRSKEEVSYLLQLMKKGLSDDLNEFHKENIRLKILGRKEGLDDDMIKIFEHAEKETKNNTRGLINICFNYGGRAEIVDAVKAIIEKGIKKIDEKTIQKYLYTHGQSDPDLVIRTSGEQRLSGFLLWQSSYSELYFPQCHWPAFTKKEFEKALEEYASRQRRYGK